MSRHVSDTPDNIAAKTSFVEVFHSMHVLQTSTVINIQQSISTSMDRFDNILIALAQVDPELNALMTSSFNDNAEANELKRTFRHMSLETRTDVLSGSSHTSGFCGPRSWRIEV